MAKSRTACRLSSQAATYQFPRRLKTWYGWMRRSVVRPLLRLRYRTSARRRRRSAASTSRKTAASGVYSGPRSSDRYASRLSGETFTSSGSSSWILPNALARSGSKGVPRYWRSTFSAK